MAFIPSSSSAPVMSSVSPSQSSETNIKRKLEDAIHSLDEAVALPLTTQPPAKKPRVGRSLYATLAKYGIKKESKPARDEYESLSKTAPHLAAILSRTASKSRKALQFQTGQTPPQAKASPTAEYRPSSMQSFLFRLSTFKLTTYANKPPAIDAVAAARCGWINDGKDRLLCELCNVSWIVAGREGLTRDAANALVERQRAQLVEMHKDGCPWKTRQCDPSIYRIPLQSPLAMAREVKSRALALDTVLQGVEIKHPLAPSQTQTLLSTMSSVVLPSFAIPDTPTENNSSDTASSSGPSEPSETAVVTSLFGWAILPPAPPRERARTQSLSRANSVTPSSPARVLSRAPSVMSLREETPTPGTPRRSPSVAPTSPGRTSGQSKPDTTLLQCALCQRRVGLWAFLPAPRSIETAAAAASSDLPAPKTQPRRQLDVLREHRSYCPYVVRSTVVPSLPTPPRADATSDSNGSGSPASVLTTQCDEQSGAMEGWRAVLTVVLRHGLARRQRLNRLANGRRSSAASANGEPETPMEVDSVEAMVADVKSHGGRDLLKYVKGLLG